MPQHLEDHTLQAYLDGEIVAEPRERVDRHLKGCAECRERLAVLDALATGAAQALARLDEGRADSAAARAAIRRAHARNLSDRRRRWTAAAAVTVLFLGAGVASAMPGSPIRAWLAGLADDDPGVVAVTEVAESREEPAAQEEDPTRVSVEVPMLEGSVVVAFLAPGAGSEIEVRLVDGEVGSVRAPATARFERGEGVVGIDLGGTAGGIEVTLPRSARNGSLTVDGRTLVRIDEGEPSFPGPTPETEEDGSVRFRLGEEASGGTPADPQG